MKKKPKGGWLAKTVTLMVAFGIRRLARVGMDSGGFAHSQVFLHLKVSV